MASKGQVIYNPVTHERITFIETTQDTGGERIVFECAVTPGGVRLAPHVHTEQEERFWVLSGTLGVMLDGKKSTLYPGQSITLPAGKKHQWWNAGQPAGSNPEFEVRFRVEVTPARNLETVLEAAAGLGNAGKLAKNGMPKNPFLLASMAKMAECYTPAAPIWMQKPMLAIGTGIARMFGYDTSLRAYRQASQIPAVPSAASRRLA